MVDQDRRCRLGSKPCGVEQLLRVFPPRYHPELPKSWRIVSQLQNWYLHPQKQPHCDPDQVVEIVRLFFKLSRRILEMSPPQSLSGAMFFMNRIIIIRLFRVICYDRHQQRSEDNMIQQTMIMWSWQQYCTSETMMSLLNEYVNVWSGYPMNKFPNTAEVVQPVVVRVFHLCLIDTYKQEVFWTKPSRI